MTEFKMTDEDLAAFKNTVWSLPLWLEEGFTIHHIWGTPDQENVNRAWQRLGENMGFKAMTVRPVPGKGQRFFTAEPVET